MFQGVENLRLFRSLDSAEKENLVVHAMVLCPEIFGTVSSKFENVPFVFLEFGQALSHNIRDLFSAGGRVKIQSETVGATEIRSIDNKLLESSANVERTLEVLDSRIVERYWKTKNIENGGTRLEKYLKLVDGHSQSAPIDVSLSTLFLEILGRR